MRVLALLALLIACNSYAQNKVVYGEDNRVNPAEANPLMQELARSTAAMMQSTSIIEKDDMVEIHGPTLEGRGICPTARFAQQISAALCSGFLVGDDLLVTAY